MELIHKIEGVRTLLDARRAQGQIIGLVPTMGALHAGHQSLIRAAADATDVVMTTIFVNPLQFSPDEDLDAYPRNLDRDCTLAEQSGADVVFAPSVAEMYPTPILTTVSPGGPLSTTLEAQTRPSHFDGVATVVAKLLNIAGRCQAFFGEKDYQQLQIVTRMVSDLDMPVDIVGCPTVREPDGLALSSRNGYLSPAERAAAPVLHRALSAGVQAITDGERDAATVRGIMEDLIAEEPLGSLDYAAVVNARTLEVPDPLAGELRLLTAVRFGSTRLLDNMAASVR